jgi:hypothetical protein
VNVKIVTKHGRSFAGAAAYLLHDEGRRSAHRVAWTDTQGLGTKDPKAAWRVMAATAMGADRLKRSAGVRASGRKASGGPVLHLVLSWAEGEISGLSPEEMRRAAREAVAQLGKDTSGSKKQPSGYRFTGDECQMLLVAHHDKAHPHVHVLLNRVHPTHGRMLPDGNDHLKLSRWAQQYQERHGNGHLTPQRTLNNDARARGEYAKGEGSKSRTQHEGAKEVSAEVAAKKGKLLAEQTRRAAAIACEQRETTARHKKEFERLEREAKERMESVRQKHREKAEAIEARRKRQTGDGVRLVRQAYRPRWETLYHELGAQVGLFRKNEEKLVGRVTNALRVIDLGALVGRSADDGRVATFREAFSVLASRGAREAALKKEHELREAALRREQKREEEAVKENQRGIAEASEMLRRGQERVDRSQARREFLAGRERLASQQKAERSALEDRWRGHNQHCRAEWKTLSLLYPAPAKEPPVAKPTRPQDLVGSPGADLAHGAKLIDAARAERERLKAQIDAQLGKEPGGGDRGDRGGRSR